MRDIMWFTCSKCGCEYPDSQFHITTNRGIYCEGCIFLTMDIVRKEKMNCE